MTTKTLGRLLITIALAGGLVSTTAGCDAINKLKGGKKDDSSKKSSDDDDDDDSKKKKKKKSGDDDDDDETPSASASASAAPAPSASAAPEASASATPSATPPPATDDVKHYPEEIPASGTFVTKKSFTVYDAADLNSKELGHLAPGTLINLKATYSNWMLVEWPSGIGELSPGWIPVKVHDTTIQETKEKIDAGKPVDAGAPTVDAGKPVVDAGTPPPVDAGKPVPVDAGKGRVPVLHVPAPKK